MGLRAWFSGPKCGDCGRKIDGPKFTRTAMGTSFWVCAPCEETRRALQDEERQRNLAAQKERQSALDHKRQPELAQSVSNRADEDIADPRVLVLRIRQNTALLYNSWNAVADTGSVSNRSDEDIAQSLAILVQQNFALLYKSWSAVADTGVVIQLESTYSFVVAFVAMAFRQWGVSGIHDHRFDRIEETLARYAYGWFLNKNPPLRPDIQPADRPAWLAKLIVNYPQVAQAHRDNFAKALNNQIGLNIQDALHVWMSHLTMTVVMQEETTANLRHSHNVEKRASLLLHVGQVITKIVRSNKEFEETLAAIAIPTNAEIAIELPKSWLLRGSAPYFYTDPATPQYNFLISVFKTGAFLESPEELLKRVLPPQAQLISLSESLVTYRSDTPELGAAKDDYHWILVDRESGAGRYATFTLSVLAASADSQETAALSTMLNEAIGHARFLGS